MSGAIAALAAKLLPIILGALLKGFTDWMAGRRGEQAQRDVGRLTAERDQAIQGRALTERMAQIAARAPQSAKTLAEMLRREAGGAK